MATYAVQTARLREVASVLGDAADATRDAAEHPGVVRARAHCGGDAELGRQTELFADRWAEGLRLMAAQTRRTADALRLAAEVYEQADRLAAGPSSSVASR